MSAWRTRALVDVDLATIAREGRRAQTGFSFVFGIDDASAIVQAFVLAKIGDVKTMIKS